MTPWVLFFGIWFGFVPESNTDYFQVFTLRFETEERCREARKVLLVMEQTLKGQMSEMMVTPCYDKRLYGKRP